jgi:hypothetical protein
MANKNADKQSNETKKINQDREKPVRKGSSFREEHRDIKRSILPLTGAQDNEDRVAGDESENNGPKEISL